MAMKDYIYRKYSRIFRGHNFIFEHYWPRWMWDEVVSLPHNIREWRKYGYYVFNEPFQEELEDFFSAILRIVSYKIELEEEKDVLECLLSFVQSLNYYKEEGEYPRYPSETLMNKGGDCEDTAILMAFIANVLMEYDCIFIHFEGSGFLGFGSWGHLDLGIASIYDGEFSGTFWRHEGRKFYYVHCNGRGYKIGDYSGR